jgi:hypothetical protein
MASDEDSLKEIYLDVNAEKSVLSNKSIKHLLKQTDNYYNE